MNKEVIGVLLGGGITNSGKLPYDARARVAKACFLLKNNIVSKLILTGSNTNRRHPNIFEARLYHDYLINNGIDKNRLLKEEEAQDTIGNAVYSKKLILKNKMSRQIMLITSNYHVSRASLIFNHILGKEFSISTNGSHTNYFHYLSKRLHEKASVEYSHQLLAQVKLGDHLQAEYFMNKFISFYR
jgi:uncharacterized SAM-binding protein YcdF (DUF218 family)